MSAVKDKAKTGEEPEVALETDLESELQAARSWVGKLIKDAYPDDARDPRRRFGKVLSVLVADGVVRLEVRFASEPEPRLVALTPQPDGHYLYPRDVKSRYRRLSELDIDELKRLAASKRAA